MIYKLKNLLSANIRNLFAVFLIFVCTYITGVQNINSPGVYFDSVCPDFIAAVGAFPGIDNFTQITQHVGLPLLGNFYHGTLTAAVQFVVLKCAGTASIYTLRLTNLFYIGIIGNIIFAFCKRISKQFFIPLAGALMSVTAQNIIIFSRTQYYIMLPGVIFFLLSFCILWENYSIHNQCSEKKLLLAGIFHGISFYAYFVFLFLAPVSIILIILQEERGQKVSHALIFSWGILLGSILYFFGYYDSLLVNLLGSSAATKIFLLLGCLILFILLAIPVVTIVTPKYRTLQNRVVKIYLRMGIAIILAGILLIICIVFIMPDKLQFLTSLYTELQNRTEKPLLISFWVLVYDLLECTTLHYAIFSESFDKMIPLHPILCILITAAVSILYYVRKKSLENAISGKVFFCLYCYLIGFYLCTLPIVSRMQPQHFVVIYFMMFITITIGLCMLCDLINSHYALATLLLVAVFCINFHNDKILLDALDRTGGRGRYSSAYDDFANEAYTDAEKDHKIYVFPEWGFHANFIYLTSNTCLTIRDVDIDPVYLQQKLDEGYTVIITAREEQTFSGLLEELSYTSREDRDWFSKEGYSVFISTSLSCEN